eukprot:jgi/Bigna1/77840/fgenesh1_pg.50_\
MRLAEMEPRRFTVPDAWGVRPLWLLPCWLAFASIFGYFLSPSTTSSLQRSARARGYHLTATTTRTPFSFTGLSARACSKPRRNSDRQLGSWQWPSIGFNSRRRGGRGGGGDVCCRVSREELDGMNYRELQALAKELGIKANQKGPLLREAILSQESSDDAVGPPPSTSVQLEGGGDAASSGTDRSTSIVDNAAEKGFDDFDTLEDEWDSDMFDFNGDEMGGGRGFLGDLPNDIGAMGESASVRASSSFAASTESASAAPAAAGLVLHPVFMIRDFFATIVGDFEVELGQDRRTGTRQRYAIIRFRSELDAQLAVGMTGRELLGQSLEIDFSHQTEEAKQLRDAVWQFIIFFVTF